eukprot:5292225-Prymnesium_polylepis.1
MADRRLCRTAHLRSRGAVLTHASSAGSEAQPACIAVPPVHRSSQRATPSAHARMQTRRPMPRPSPCWAAT